METELLFVGESGDRALLYSFALLILMVMLFLSEPAEHGPGRAAPARNEDVCGLVAAEYGLTPRETEILGYLIEGRSHPFIRDELCISKGTVDSHLRHIYAKVGVSSKQDLISAASTAPPDVGMARCRRDNARIRCRLHRV